MSQDDEDISAGGSHIKRYGPPEAFSWPSSAGEHFDELHNHLAAFLGTGSMVWHEIISDKVHLDVIAFAPTAERQCWTLVTSGMSDKPMPVPDLDEYQEMRFAEIAISLPADWFSTDEAGLVAHEQLEDEEKYWPIRLIKFLARLPHDYDAWLWRGHTVPNYDPPEPYTDNTTMNGAILLAPITWDEGEWSMRRKDGNKVSFLAAVPIYSDEMDFKLAHGEEALVEKLDKAGVTEILDITRASAVSKRRYFGLFRN